jgi:hypothetical protein
LASRVGVDTADEADVELHEVRLELENLQERSEPARPKVWASAY